MFVFQAAGTGEAVQRRRLAAVQPGRDGAGNGVVNLAVFDAGGIDAELDGAFVAC